MLLIYCFRNSCTGFNFVCVSNWSHRYCSAVIGVASMCLLFLVIVLPVVVSLYYVGLVIVIVITLLSCTVGPSITVFPPDSYSRSYGKNSIIVGSIIYFYHFLFVFSNYTLWYSSSLSMLIISLFINCTIPLVGWLNSSVAGLESPGPSSIVLTCNREWDVYLI